MHIYLLMTACLSAMAASSPQGAEGPPALREGPSTLTVSAEDGLAVAERLVEDGRYDAAESILTALMSAPNDAVDNIKVRFLLALAAIGREDFKKAVGLLRGILSERPELVRVRLELARALFAMRRDQAAAYHFRLAMAGDLPAETIQNIKLFLVLIERRKAWRIHASVAVSPDSNVNAGPKDSVVEIFGLPFELDENARERSGVGLSSSLSAEAFPRLRGPFRLEVRAAAHFSDYENNHFDDLYTAIEAGPRFERGGFRVSALATASRRFYGGEGYNRSFGGRLSATKGITSRTEATLQLGGAVADYDGTMLRDGPVYSAGLAVRRTLDRRSAASLSASATREQTRESVMRNTQYRLGASYLRELPLGVTAEVGPELYYRTFDHYDATIGAARRDWAYGAGASFIKRDWRVYGFAPVVSYRYVKNDSNADRFRYDRHRVNVGLTRSF